MPTNSAKATSAWTNTMRRYYPKLSSQITADVAVGSVIAHGT
ncbi:hypothetical protein [Sulfitobacter indolifex]|nr:hypothetical protein [Sulfitobacter indolifex]